jgi:hypothetical protein
MIRLHFVVEGKTEKTFADDVLGPELYQHAVYADARLVETGRRGSKRFRGGSLKYAHWKRDLTLWMKQDGGADARFTSMIDLFRLPKDFPAYAQCSGIADPLQRVSQLERHFGSDIGDRRFVPHIQLHEFETLLFADVTAFLAAYPTESGCIPQLVAIRQAFPSIEHINDGPQTAPSKQIAAVLPGYQKDPAGAIIAIEIGLTKMCAESQHFRNWLEQLRALGQRAANP